MRTPCVTGLLAGLVILAVPDAVVAQAVISEVMWAGSDVSTADEWLELTTVDSSQLTIDIGEWTLSTRKGNGEETVIIEFPEGATLEPGQYLIVANYSAGQSRLAREPDFVTTAMSLPNTKLLLRLYDAQGNIVDEVDDGVGAPFAGSSGSDGASKASMERIDLAGLGNLKENWATAGTSQGFDEGDVAIFGTPGFENGSSDDPLPTPAPPPDPAPEPPNQSPFGGAQGDGSGHAEPEPAPTPNPNPPPEPEPNPNPEPVGPPQEPTPPAAPRTGGTPGAGVQPSLLITEILANPIGRDDAEWVEIANVGDTPVAVADYFLGVRDASRRYVMKIPALAPGEHVSFPKNVTGLSLPNGGATVELLQGDTLIDAVPYPEAIDGVSFGRRFGNGELQSFCIPTEGEPNTPPPLDPRIAIQSGETEGVGELSINLEAALPVGSLAIISCSWDYGDGFTSDSCNPSLHRFTKPGTYDIRLRVEAVCEETHERGLMVHVKQEIEEREDSAPTFTGAEGSKRREVLDRDQPEKLCNENVRQNVIISAALPNPRGKDREGEWVELINVGDTTISLDGCFLDNKDGGSRPFPLDGIDLDPQELRRFPIEETGITLTNSEDSVRLLDHEGRALSVLSWTKAPEGQIYRPPVLQSPRISARVLEVIDGDTIDVELIGIENIRGAPDSLLRRWRMVEERNRTPSILVRLLGIDAPESVHPFKGVEQFGIEASNSLRALLEGKDVELEFDRSLWDHYERLLAYIYKEGDLVQEMLLQEGLARVEERFPFARSAAFQEFEREAKKAKRGLWGAGAGENEAPNIHTDAMGTHVPATTLSINDYANFLSTNPNPNPEPAPHPKPNPTPTPHPFIRPRYRNVSQGELPAEPAPHLPGETYRAMSGSSMFDGLTFVEAESAAPPLQPAASSHFPIPIEPLVITLLVIPAVRMLLL